MTTYARPRTGGPEAAPPARTVEDRNRLVTDNLALVGWAIKKWFRQASAVYGVPEEDLAQEGYIGLLRAAELWDPARGTFATCAAQWIRQRVGRYLLGADFVRVPVHVTGAERRELRARLAPRGWPVLPSGDEATLPDPGSPDPAAEAAERERLELGRHVAEDLLRQLHPRPRFVVEQRLAGRKLQDIADELQLSRERVRQIQLIAIRRLRRLARRRAG
jgi:RNA polymerase sigma factor (sigma-70 family)